MYLPHNAITRHLYDERPTKGQRKGGGGGMGRDSGVGGSGAHGTAGGLLRVPPPSRACRVSGYAAGFRQGMYGHVPRWFSEHGLRGEPGHDNDAMASFYFNQLRHMAAVRSVDEVENDLSGGLTATP